MQNREELVGSEAINVACEGEYEARVGGKGGDKAEKALSGENGVGLISCGPSTTKGNDFLKGKPILPVVQKYGLDSLEGGPIYGHVIKYVPIEDETTSTNNNGGL